MTTLDADQDVVTVINTFTVDPSRAEDLLALLERATLSVSKLPGFVSANFHMAKDKTSIINYAQWRSAADIKAMMEDPEAQEQLAKTNGIVQNMNPVLCRLRSTHGRTA